MDDVKTLIGLVVLLIIGVVLNSQNAPPPLSSIGGIFALVGGLGFAVYIFRLLRIWK